MRSVEPLLPEQERAREQHPRRPAPPAPVDRLLALQRSAGNRAVARFLEVRQIDFNPKSGNFHTSHLDVPLFLTTITDSNLFRTLNGTEKQRLQAIDQANLHALDVPQLATAVIAYLAGNAQPRINAMNPHRSNLEGSLVVALEKEVSDKEEGVFKNVLAQASVKSRSKAQPSQIDLAKLPDKMGTAVTNRAAAVQARNQQLGLIPTYTQGGGLSPAELAYSGLPARGAHMNRAGWIANHVAPATLDVAASAWATLVAANGPAPYQTELRTAFGFVPANVTAKAIEEHAALSIQTKNKYYGELLRVQLATARGRATHAWKQYADDTLVGCPFIEFTAEDAGGLSRYVWDFVNDQWYIGVHYNWVLGYNPFFLVNGLPATY